MMQKATPEEIREDPKKIVEEQLLHVVKKFKYLGGHLSNDWTMSDEIRVRMLKTAASFSKLYQRVWKKNT